MTKHTNVRVRSSLVLLGDSLTSKSNQLLSLFILMDVAEECSRICFSMSGGHKIEYSRLGYPEWRFCEFLSLPELPLSLRVQFQNIKNNANNNFLQHTIILPISHLMTLLCSLNMVLNKMTRFFSNVK